MKTKFWRSICRLSNTLFCASILCLNFPQILQVFCSFVLVLNTLLIVAVTILRFENSLYVLYAKARRLKTRRLEDLSISNFCNLYTYGGWFSISIYRLTISQV